ncbi:MAG: tetratricopeptide repeat protein [Candidatus Cloacimonetes bacterium]|nr:tetratricopeptide repeat protein [Candidatus Cloacimonadota bacterium]
MPRTIPIILALMLLAFPLLAQRGITESYQAEASGEYDTALAIMRELQSAEPADAFYQVRVAWLLYLQGNYGDAVSAYEAALRLRDSLDAQLGRLNSLLALGRYSEALQHSRAQIRLHPENTDLLGKGAYSAYMLKDYSTAAEFFARIAELYPWDMENRAYLMNNLYLNEQEAAAREQYQFLKKYYPQSTLLPNYQRIFEP